MTRANKILWLVSNKMMSGVNKVKVVMECQHFRQSVVGRRGGGGGAVEEGPRDSNLAWQSIGSQMEPLPSANLATYQLSLPNSVLAGNSADRKAGRRLTRRVCSTH